MFLIKDDENKANFSFIKGLVYPLMTTSDNMKNFLMLTCFFSLITTVISLSLGRAFMCGLEYSFDAEVGVFCSFSVFNQVLSVLVNLVCISLYVNRVGMIKEKQEKNFWFLQRQGVKKELKSFFVVCLFLLFWGIICGLGYLLKIRQPVADWKIEISIFAIASLGMIVFIFLLLDFVVFVHWLKGGRFFEIKKVFWPVFDELFKLMTWFFIYLFIFSFLFLSVFRFFVRDLSFLGVFGNEFCIYFVLYFMVAMMYFSFEYQEKTLFCTEK